MKLSPNDQPTGGGSVQPRFYHDRGQDHHHYSARERLSAKLAEYPCTKARIGLTWLARAATYTAASEPSVWLGRAREGNPLEQESAARFSLKLLSGGRPRSRRRSSQLSLPMYRFVRSLALLLLLPCRWWPCGSCHRRCRGQARLQCL